MKFQFPLFLLAGAAGTAAAVILLTPDPTRDLSPPSESSLPPTPKLAAATRAPAATRESRRAEPLEYSAPPPSSRSAAPQFAVPLPAPNFPSPSGQPADSLLANQAPSPSHQATAAPAPSSGFEGTPSRGEMAFPLVRSLPASFVDAGNGATQAQIDALDRIADDFERQIAPESAPTAANPNAASRIPPHPDWNAATQAANERYRQIFGVDLYNAWTTQAAKEALLERQQAVRR